MDWAINGVRLLGLALFGVWEYLIFRQRYGTRRRELQAKQIEGAAAVMRAASALYTATQHSQPANQSQPISEQQLRSLYAEAAAVHTQWIAFLPGKLNAAIAEFLTIFARAAASGSDVADPAFQQHVRRAYIELVARVLQTLGIEPLGPPALAALEQRSKAPFA